MYQHGLCRIDREASDQQALLQEAADAVDQTRVKTLNQELGAVFQWWYPDMQLEEDPQAA